MRFYNYNFSGKGIEGVVNGIENLRSLSLHGNTTDHSKIMDVCIEKGIRKLAIIEDI